MHEGHRERMRDRLFADEESVSDHELLEMLLFYCISRKNTNPVAHDLLEGFGDLRGVFSAPPALLGTVDGVGAHTAEFLALIGTLYSRIRREDGARRPHFLNFADTCAFVKERFCGVEEETLELYCLGGEGTLVYLRSVRNARHDRVGIDAKFVGFILSQIRPQGLIVAHNHPSGDMHPSAEDDKAVREILRICALYGTKLNDNIIYTRNGSFSYYCSGRLDQARKEREGANQVP